MSYISHVDYKKMMEGFKQGTPKGLLKEELEQEGNAFTAGLAKAKKGEEFKVDGKSVKDTSNYDAPVKEAEGTCPGCGMPSDQCTCSGEMDESHETNDQWYDEFQAAISGMGLDPHTEADVMKALDHVDPLAQYGDLPAAQAAKDFVEDLGYGDYDDHEPDTDADYEEPRDDFDMAGDFNDGEFWENEIKKLQELAGVKPHDDGPEDDDEDEREKRAKKMEMDDEEAENAEREDEAVSEDIDSNATYSGRTTNLGDTGSSIEFTVTANTPEYFDIDYVITPNSKHRPVGASSRSPREKEYGSARISKTNPDGTPLKDWEKQSIRVKGDSFSIGKLGAELYDGAENVAEVEGGEKPNMHSDREVAKIVAQKHGKELKDLVAIYDANLDADHKVRNKAWKDFENAAINWAGHEMLEAGMNKVAVRNLLSGYGYYEDWIPDYLDNLKHELKGMEEGLHMPPLQATGQTIVTNEDQAPFGMSVLSPDERKQLKEYINSYKTIKTEISKLLAKAGKSGKIMEGLAEDEAVPAERKAKYKDPTTVPTQHKHSNLGGNRTNLVMTKAEMWEGAGRMEDVMNNKLKEAFEKVTGMIMKDLMEDGFDEGDIKLYLDHIIEEKAKEAATSQHDF